VETDKPLRSSQFRILDFLLLTAGCAYALAILIPAADREPNGKVVAVAITVAMALTGSAISYPIWRYLLRRRFTVLAVNHLGYFLALVVLGIVWDDELFEAVPILAGGPLSFFGYTYPLVQAFPFVGKSWDGIFIIGFLTAPTVFLMCAHSMRQNLIDVILTSLGTALWYIFGFGAGLARMY